MSELEEEGEEEEIIAEEESEAAGAEEKTAPANAPAGNPLAADPYDFDKCTITMQVVLLPEDGHAQGRNVIIAVRNHQDAPVIRSYRMDEVDFGETLGGILDDLRGVVMGRAMDKILKDTKVKKAKKEVPVSAAASVKKEPIVVEQKSLFG